jgi:hypothetical protein
MKPGDLVKATDKLRLLSGFIINVGDVGLVTGMADVHWGSSRHLSVLIGGQCVDLHPNMLELVNDVS